MNQLNDDYQRAKAEIKKLKEANEALPNSGEMNDLIEKYSRDSTEMLLCIETLELENSDLKTQLGIQSPIIDPCRRVSRVSRHANLTPPV